MIENDDEAFADNYAERDQAKALCEQARAGGLRFEAYLPGDMADWLLAQVEGGHFVDPSEAVFAIVKNFIDMEPHRDLRDELLRRILDESVARGLEDVKAGRQVSTLKIFNITRDKDGVFVLAVPAMKEKDRDQLRSFGIKVNGRAEVFLPANAKVFEHNATGTPGLLSKSYSWKIGAVDDRPMIRFTLAQ